jgi:DNA-binding NtrC family response regulator
MKTILNKNILIADDDEGMLRALQKVLTGEGANVLSTANPGDAVEMLTRKENEIDLAITDLRMPYISGLTLVHYIHQNFPALPVIVLTAFGSPAVKSECEHEGAAAFLEKPVEAQQLLATIKNVLKL